MPDDAGVLMNLSIPITRRLTLAAALAGLTIAGGATAQQQKVVTIAATEPMTTDNPYADSSGPVYAMWCHIYGCLGRYDYTRGRPVGILVEKWEQTDPLTWRFVLRKDLKRHDGGPGPTSKDVIHTLERIRKDPESAQRSFVATVDRIEEVDEHTFLVKTKQPAVNLVLGLFDRMIITSAELYAKHGREADKKHAFGWGPYQMMEYQVDRRVVLRKHPHGWKEPDGQDTSAMPDVVIHQAMREPEQRVTALLNNEVQLARYLPPQLLRRLENRKEVKVTKSGSIEVMFIAFNNKMAPWTDVRLRRAVAHSVNRQLIVDRLLGGLATVQDGLIGPNQYCYTGKPERTNAFDPVKAKALLAEAGFKDGGPEIDFYTAVGRYQSDRQVAEAVAQMLRQVGFKVRLHTPEYANFWADVRRGKSPMYYMGRGTIFDPSDAAGQLYSTGITPRVQYSNPKFDKLLEQQYAETDEKKRCALWREMNQILIDDVPSHFMWTHTVLTGLRANVDIKVEQSGEFWLATSKVK
jgi:peptide/nickel transport system substrate-binding protein